jgi:hypothetical protein
MARRHSGERRNPLLYAGFPEAPSGLSSVKDRMALASERSEQWIPAFAGMTAVPSAM